MPLNISVNRKYLPALSNEDSLRSSQRSFVGNRKPCGGGPAGVAARKALEEKAAIGYGRERKGDLVRVAEGRQWAQRAVAVFFEAIL